MNVGDATEISETDIAESRRAKLQEMQPGTGMSYTAHFKLPEQATALARLIADHKSEGGFRDLGRDILERCLELAESAVRGDPEQARGLTSEPMIAAATEFPELQAKLKALHDQLGEPTIVDAMPAATTRQKP